MKTTRRALFAPDDHAHAGLLLAAVAGIAATTASAVANEPTITPIALEYQRYTGGVAGHVYVNMRTGERVINRVEAIGDVNNRGIDWTWGTTVPDPCEGAAGVDPSDQGISVFTGIMSEANGDKQQPNAVRMWQNWFDAPADSVIDAVNIQYYTGLQDPNFIPGEDSGSLEPAGIPGYNLILTFNERDDPSSQSTAVAHSPILISELPGANDDDLSGDIEFAEGRLWTFFLDLADTPIEVADTDNSSTNPQGVDSDAPGTVGAGLIDCGFTVSFTQPGVIEGNEHYTNNAFIDFSGVAQDIADATGESGPADLSTFPNIEPTGSGLYAPSNRLDTFVTDGGVIAEWPNSVSVIVEPGEGFGAWDGMEIFDATGADESGPDQLFFFGGFSCNTPGGGLDGFAAPFSAFYLDINQGGIPGGGCWGDGIVPCNSTDIAEPFGVLDLNDITAFIVQFQNGELPCADLDGNGILDLADIVGFVTAFQAGCP